MPIFIYERMIPVEDKASYRSPENGMPFSPEGLLDMAHQLFDEAKKQDSSLLELAGLAIRRTAHDQLASESPNSLNRLLGCLDRAENFLASGEFTYRDLDQAAVHFQLFAEKLRKTNLAASA